MMIREISFPHQEDKTLPSMYIFEPTTYGMLCLADRAYQRPSLQTCCVLSTLVTRPLDQILKILATGVFATGEHFIHMASLIDGKRKISFAWRLFATPVWLPVKVALKVLGRGLTSLILIVADTVKGLLHIPSNVRDPRKEIHVFFSERNKLLSDWEKGTYWNCLPKHAIMTMPKKKIMA